MGAAGNHSFGHCNFNDERLKDKYEYLRHDKTDNLRTDEHGEVRRLVAGIHEAEIDERDHHRRHEGRINKVGNNGLDNMSF